MLLPAYYTQPALSNKQGAYCYYYYYRGVQKVDMRRWRHKWEIKTPSEISRAREREHDYRPFETSQTPQNPQNKTRPDQTRNPAEYDTVAVRLLPRREEPNQQKQN